MTNNMTCMKKLTKRIQLLSLTLLSLVLVGCLSLGQKYQSYDFDGSHLSIYSNEFKLELTAMGSGSIEVAFSSNNKRFENLPSFAIQENVKKATASFIDSEDKIYFSIDGDANQLQAQVNKNDLSVEFYLGGKLLTTQRPFARDNQSIKFDFTLTDEEKLLGGGQRVLGMDRRGHRMPLYNRAHYGYATESNQMYFSMPGVMSNKHYSIIFDNSASGFLDIGKTQEDTLSFEAVSGRSAYIISAGSDYPSLIKHQNQVLGNQPLPPRWAFGNYASRFGYKSQKEVEDTVAKFIEEDIPLDTIILDLYWFGPDVKGHMGNLEWDRDSFPKPKEMISNLKDKGVNTVPITEPFILSTSKKWDEAVTNKALAKNEMGEPYRYDFYFGNTGLVDVFDTKAQAWFWQSYEKLFDIGVAGTWGDLGEPEVHPNDIQHYFSKIGRQVRGDEIHNVYGHQWAKMVFENQRKLQRDTRPFIMMRSGFAGSHRYGMIPWTGDVSRSWGGLKPQVELSLQMGMFGMAYNHSDLGGFAGGEKFDQELYIRWLQYGVFQPVYRPHAQDNIAPEPIFHDQQTKDIIREYVKLRYKLLPYIYTMAYENSTTGMPLMRPLSFLDASNEEYFDNQSSYLWGDSFLVSPITEPGLSSKTVYLPEGVWFNFWNNQKHLGNQEIDFKLSLDTIPVLVKAGSFIPMVESVQSTKDYSSKSLQLHYYADTSVKSATGKMYEDDGKSFDSIDSQKFELLNFQMEQVDENITINLTREGGDYQNMPDERTVELIIHGIEQSPNTVSINGLASQFQFNAETQLVTIPVVWDHTKTVIKLNYNQ